MLLVPLCVTNHIDQLQQTFLRQGGKENSKKYHLINWKIVISPPENDVIAIHDSNSMNKFLGDKILWNLATFLRGLVENIESILFQKAPEFWIKTLVMIPTQ